MHSKFIYNLLILFALVFSQAALSQEELPECQIAFTSEHYVLNASSHAIKLSVDHRDQGSFPTDGPRHYTIPADQEMKVSELEWAGEFRDPCSWYVFTIQDQDSDSSLAAPDRWVFEQVMEYEGRYLFTYSEE